MNKKFILELALKNMLSHRLRTFLTLLGVVIGISAIVFLVSFGFGIEKLVTNEISGGDAFRLVDVGTGNSQLVKLNPDNLEKFSDLPETKSVESTLNVAAKVSSDNKVIDASLFASSNRYLEWSGIRTVLGEPYDEQKTEQVIVSESIMSFLAVAKAEDLIGKKIKLELTLPTDAVDGSEPIVVGDKEFTIVGAIKGDDSIAIYVPMKVLADIGAENFTQVKVEVSERGQVATLRGKIENMGFKTQYVGDTVSQIEQIFNVFKIILGSFGLIALIVASLGMFNTLTISLLERMKEVALLKILGAKSVDVARLFITESLMFGVVGGAIGLAMGILFGNLANSILNYYAVNVGGDSVNVFYYPIWFVVAILIFSTLVGFITGWYPARRAAKVSSLDVIRYE